MWALHTKHLQSFCVDAGAAAAHANQWVVRGPMLSQGHHKMIQILGAVANKKGPRLSCGKGCVSGRALGTEA